MRFAACTTRQCNLAARIPITYPDYGLAAQSRGVRAIEERGEGEGVFERNAKLFLQVHVRDGGQGPRKKSGGQRAGRRRRSWGVHCGKISE
jgi:hypothetical protein